MDEFMTEQSGAGAMEATETIPAAIAPVPELPEAEPPEAEASAPVIEPPATEAPAPVIEPLTTETSVPEPEPSAPEPTPMREPLQMEPRANRAEPRRSLKSIVAVVALASVLGGFSLGLGIGVVNTAVRIIMPQTTAETEESKPAELPVASEVMAFSNPVSSALSKDDNLPGSFSELIQMVEPSVVTISSVMSSNQSYFGLPETPRGSGIIFKEDDEKVYIVTNYHVVSGAESVSISVAGGESVNAGMVGKDKQADIAVLYVTKVELAEAGVGKVTLARFGDSDNMQTGDIVLAIGNAMGEGNTSTLGIISAKNKEIKVDGLALTVIQTDAAINPGNSGGPLVNMRGEVIGINAAKTMQQSFGSSAEGMGYSIAANIVTPIVDEIMLMKPKAFLGISGNTLSSEIAQQFNIPELGVFVEEVYSGTAAEIAGLQRTDIITAFNGQAVFTMTDLQEAVKACTVGQEVEIKILRDGKTSMTLKAKLLASDDGSF